LSREDLEENSQVFKDLKKALHLTESTSAQIRSLAHNLRPAALDDLGLDLALEGFCHEFADRTQLAISYTGDDGIARSDARGTCFYRLLQEALTNVAKHAQAQQVEVILACNSDEVSLSVIDDGLGFNLQPNLYNGKKPGIGLLGMQERLETLGGKLNIESGPDMGTRLVATLPIWPGNE
jgi:two-component system NarL family sensor kinase